MVAPKGKNCLQVEEGLPKALSDASEKETSLLSGEIEAGTSEANLSEINLNLLQVHLTAPNILQISHSLNPYPQIYY